MKKTFNWGIIGCGRIAHKFANDVKTIDGARIYAVATRSLDKAMNFAKTYNAPHALDSYQALLKVEDVDAVYIATPHVLHAENAIMCLKAKMPVLCEKPLAMNARQVSQMIAAAEANNTFLMEALWTRFMPPINKVLELIQAGEIGELHSVKADFGFAAEYKPEGRLFDPALGGGSLLDIGIYPVFLALLLFGKPEHIDARAVLGPTQVDNICGMLLKFPGDKIAILDSTILSDTKTEAFIYGSKGHIHIHSRWHEMTSLSLQLKGEGEAQNFEFENKCLGYRYEAEEVMRCVASGKKQSERMPHAFSTLLIKTLDAIRQKAGIVYSVD
jgi:predicted dehydrogenase